jgi:hypothetical protein
MLLPIFRIGIEGYGISFKGIDFADDNGFRLLSL